MKRTQSQRIDDIVTRLSDMEFDNWEPRSEYDYSPFYAEIWLKYHAQISREFAYTLTNRGEIDAA